MKLIVYYCDRKEYHCFKVISFLCVVLFRVDLSQASDLDDEIIRFLSCKHLDSPRVRRNIVLKIMILITDNFLNL